MGCVLLTVQFIDCLREHEGSAEALPLFFLTCSRTVGSVVITELPAMKK